MKKTVYTLNINYTKEVTDLTYPLLQGWAKKIGAEFYVIDKRQYPDFPVVYEKLQIFELGRKNDWNIYVDSDALVHPDMFDPTEHLNKDTVMHNGNDMAGNRWKYDNYFRRDGRHIGSCNWFTIASDWCLDLWHPLEDITLEQALENIFPIVNELTCKAEITREHLIDDYALSRNIARYGLKFKTLRQLLSEIDPNSWYLWHEYVLSMEEKLGQMKTTLSRWKCLQEEGKEESVLV